MEENTNTLLLEMQISIAIMENDMEVSIKQKNLLYEVAIFLPEMHSKEM